MWVADRVDEALEEYRELHGISGTWETRERVVVAITGAPGGDDVLRRAARMAMRTRGELLGRARPAGRRARDRFDRAADRAPPAAGRARWPVPRGQRRRRRGGARSGSRAPRTRASSCWARAGARGGASSSGARSSTGCCGGSGPIDVHVISTDPIDARRERRRCADPRGAPTSRRRRQTIGWLLAVLGPPLLAVVLSAGDEVLGLPSVLLLFLMLVVVVAVIGGLLPAIVAAVARVAAQQLLLHAAVPHVHDRRGREPARAARVPRRRRGR